MSRTTQQVFDHHKTAIERGDIAELVEDYADDAILVTLDGSFVGKAAIQSFFESAFASYPNLKVSFDSTAVAEDAFLLQWSGDSDTASIPYGTGAFVILDGKMYRQMEWFVDSPKDA